MMRQAIVAFDRRAQAQRDAPVAKAPASQPGGSGGLALNGEGRKVGMAFFPRFFAGPKSKLSAFSHLVDWHLRIFQQFEVAKPTGSSSFSRDFFVPLVPPSREHP
jgi:hypothetical protein